jgi:uroporphyrinogen decarboxylase
MLPVDQYEEFALPYVQRIFDSIDGVPKIFFPKGGWSLIPLFKDLKIDGLSIDWKTSPAYIREHLGDNIVLQGNLDPCQLYAPVLEIEAKTRDMITQFGGRHIVNLGHGVYPDTSYQHVQSFVQTVKSYRY